jgi:hypothetical protein
VAHSQRHLADVDILKREPLEHHRLLCSQREPLNGPP